MEKEQQIKNLLSRNVVEVIEKSHLENKLHGKKKMRIKLGIDPTGPKLHLGRAIALRKLKEFQDLGHQIVLIIGDFTALVGDASDKESARPQLTKEKIKSNMKDYKKQIGLILDIKKTEFRFNSEWLGKLKFEEVLKLASLFTVHQLIDRRNFKERFDAGKVIGFHEFLYPLMQGYDSVAIEADVEIGGTDQLFNFKAGRKLQDFFGQDPQDIMTLEMLDGLDGRKMSTTYGNVINITDEPEDMYGKVMSMKDDLIVKYFTVTTDVSLEKIKQVEEALKGGLVNPFDLKKELAFTLVKLYHGEKKAEKAADVFVKVFQQKELSQDMVSIKVEKGAGLKDILVKEAIVSSVGGFRRLINSGAVDFDGEVVSDIHYKIEKPGVVRVGKKTFVRLVF